MVVAPGDAERGETRRDEVSNLRGFVQGVKANCRDARRSPYSNSGAIESHSPAKSRYYRRQLL